MKNKNKLSEEELNEISRKNLEAGYKFDDNDIDFIPEYIEREDLIEFLNNKIRESEIEEEKFDFEIENIEDIKSQKIHKIPKFNSFEEFEQWLNNGGNNEK